MPSKKHKLHLSWAHKRWLSNSLRFGTAYASSHPVSINGTKTGLSHTLMDHRKKPNNTATRGSQSSNAATSALGLLLPQQDSHIQTCYSHKPCVSTTPCGWFCPRSTPGQMIASRPWNNTTWVAGSAARWSFISSRRRAT